MRSAIISSVIFCGALQFCFFGFCEIGASERDVQLKASRLWSIKSRAESISFSPTQPILAICSSEIEILDARNGRQLRTLQSDHHVKRCISFSPDGAYLATGSVGQPVATVWSTKTWKVHASLDAHETMPIDRLNFSPDSKLLATSDGKNVFVWDVRTGRQVHQIPTEKSSWSGVCFTASEPWLVFYDGYTVKAWNHQLGTERRQEVAWSAERLCAIPKTTLVAIGRGDEKSENKTAVLLWDVENDQRRDVLEMSQSRRSLRQIVCNSQGSLVFALAAGSPGDCYVYDMNSKKALGYLPVYTGFLYSVAVSPDDATIVFGTGNDTVEAYSLPSIH